MEITTREQIWEALDFIEDNENIANKEIAFKCVQATIRLGLKKLEFDARNKYLTQLVFCNFIDEALIQYAWLLNYKKNNELKPGSIHSVLWKFKWIIDKLPEYHTIPLSKINEAIAQFEEEYRAAGNTEKVLEYKKAFVQMAMGNLDKVEVHYQNYKKSTQTGEYDDCYACQLSSLVSIEIMRKDYRQAIETAKDVVNKKYTCAEVPNITYPKLVFVHLMLGEPEKAEEYFQLSLKNLKLSIPQDGIYRLLFYLGKTKGFVQGKKIIDRQLHFFLETKSDMQRYDFYSGCYIFFKKMYADDIKTFKIKLPDNSTFLTPLKKDEYDVALLKQWFYEQALQHGSLLDKRNENTFYLDNLKWLDEVLS